MNLLGDTRGGVVVDQEGAIVGVVGRPRRDLFGGALSTVASDAEIFVVLEGSRYVGAASFGFKPVDESWVIEMRVGE